MIISKKRLTEILDSTDIDNQQVMAGEALSIHFGQRGTKPDDNDCFTLVGGGSLAIEFTEKGEVLAIEIVTH
jgi:hypothetical protein